MNPDDPRHGTQRGRPAHIRAGQKPCQACAEANAAYQRRDRKTRALYGPHLIPATGTIRRVHALMAIGWSMEEISRKAGMHQRQLWGILNRPTGIVQRKTARTIARAYDKLSMTVPDPQTRGERVSVNRTIAHARRKGYAPPLAWDDIDNPDERPIGILPQTKPRRRPSGDIDPVNIQRLLLLERSPDTTRAEKDEALRRWLAEGGSEKAFCEAHGLKPGRYKPARKEAA